MAAGRLIFPGLMPCVDANGDRVAGARAYFYANGTTTAANTYTDAALTIPATNPVIADGVGVWPAMWADTATVFTVSITDASGVPLPGGTWSGVSSATDATLVSSNLAAAAQAAAVVAETGAQAAEAGAQAAQAQAAAYAAAIAGAPFNATSAANLTIGTGTKTFPLDQFGKLYNLGQTVVIAETSAPATVQMTGIVTAVPDPVTKIMSVLVASVVGAGTHADWTISLAATGGIPASRQLTAAGLVTGGGDLSVDRSFTVTAALAADVRTGTDTTKAVTAGALAGSAAPIVLTDAATVSWNAALGYNAGVTLGGNRTIGAPTGLIDGLTYVLDVTQDATGSRVPSYNAIWDFGNFGTPTHSTGAGKTDSVAAKYSAARSKLEVFGFRKSA